MKRLFVILRNGRKQIRLPGGLYVPSERHLRAIYFPSVADQRTQSPSVSDALTAT
jgi:hypothetical protein